MNLTEQNTEQNTELNSNFSQIDENELIFEQKIEKIREKTFNTELRNLVEKITANKTEKKDKKIIQEKPVVNESFIAKMHKLFYKAINIDNYQKINANFNPFSIKTEINKKVLLKSIQKQLDKLGINEFAYLFYNNNRKSFFPVENTFETIAKDNLVLSLSENVFKRIHSSKDGFLLERTYLSGNLIQQRRTGLISSRTGNLFCISLHHLSASLWKNLVNLENGNVNEKLFSPILILSYDTKGKVSKKLFFRKIQKKLSILYYMYFTLHENKMKVNKQYIEKPVQTINNFIHLYESNREISPLIFKNRSDYDNETFILMKHIYNKMKNLISQKSAIQYLERNKILLFLHCEDEPYIRKYLNEINKIYINKFEIHQIRK